MVFEARYYALLLPGVALPPENVIIFTCFNERFTLWCRLPSLIDSKLRIIKCVTLWWGETFNGRGIGAVYLVESSSEVNIWEPGGNVQIT